MLKGCVVNWLPERCDVFGVVLLVQKGCDTLQGQITCKGHVLLHNIDIYGMHVCMRVYIVCMYGIGNGDNRDRRDKDRRCRTKM